MKQITVFLTLTVLLGLLTACNQQGVTTPVGIINIEKVSKETGNTDLIQKEMQNVRTRLNTNLQTLQKKLTTTIQESQKKMGDNPTNEQRAELGKTLTSVKIQMQQAQLSAETELKKAQDTLIIKLRKMIQPVAKRIASQRGMQVILFDNNNVVFGKDQKTDITDAVIAELKKQGGDLPEKK